MTLDEALESIQNEELGEDAIRPRCDEIHDSKVAQRFLHTGLTEFLKLLSPEETLAAMMLASKLPILQSAAFHAGIDIGQKMVSATRKEKVN